MSAELEEMVRERVHTQHAARGGIREIVELADILEPYWSAVSDDAWLTASSNGRLPSDMLSSIPGGRLEHKAARAWNDMYAYIGKQHGIWIRPTGPNSSYRTYAAQQYFWNLYQSGRGNVAAYPGTSNHGWGKAVDVATPTMAYYIRKYGSRFGWSWAEGQRVGEWWHFTYVGGYDPPKKKKPFWFLTSTEEEKVKALLRLRKKNHGKKDWSRREVRKGKRIKKWMTKRRAHIQRQADAETNGWRKHHRARRHRVLGKVRDNKPVKDKR